MTQNRTLSLILPAFGAAIIAALAQIVIPIGAVPITLQTFAVGLVAAILKPREATLAATLYLILGAIGLPVFAGGGGGLQAFFSPSAGYLLAYPFFAFVTSKLTHAETPIWKIFVTSQEISLSHIGLLIRTRIAVGSNLAQQQVSIIDTDVHIVPKAFRHCSIGVGCHNL